jgi:hypothetical protein
MSDQFYVPLLSNASQKLYPENTIGAFPVKFARPIDFASDGNWEVGLWEFTCPPDTVGTIYKINVVGDHIGLIDCDLISPQFVGGNLVRYLRTCQHEFENVYYLPVEKRRITNIRIEILSTSGNKVAFKSGKNPSKLVLHFRKCDINRSYNRSHSTFGDYESPGTILPPSLRSWKE